MQLTQETEGRLTVIHIEGAMTTDGVGEFTELVVKCMSEQTCDFLLDASLIDFIDSKGLETLLWLKGVAHEKLGQIRIVAPTEQVREILKLTRLDSEFELMENKQEAVASLC